MLFPCIYSSWGRKRVEWFTVTDHRATTRTFCIFLWKCMVRLRLRFRSGPVSSLRKDTITCSGIQNDRDIQNPFRRHIYHSKPFGNVRSGNRHYMRRELQKFWGKYQADVILYDNLCLQQNNFWDVMPLLPRKKIQKIPAFFRISYGWPRRKFSVYMMLAY